jgi:hypothetical protein
MMMRMMKMSRVVLKKEEVYKNVCALPTAATEQLIRLL